MHKTWWLDAPGAKATVLAATAAIVALGSGAIAWRAGFDGLYGQDPFAYYEYAVGPLRTRLVHAGLPPPFFWPPGYPLLVAFASLVIGPVPAAAQFVSILAGAAVPPLTMWLCHELLTDDSRSARRLVPETAAVAGLLAACCGQLSQWSVMIMADTTGLATATFGAASIARYLRTGRLRWLTAAAAGLAWAVLSRWAFAAVALPCAAAALARLTRTPPRVRLWHAAVGAVVAALVLLPVWQPLIAHLAGRAAPNAPFIGDLQVIGWNPLNMFKRSWVDIDGFVQFRLVNGVYYLTAPGRWFYFTPLLALFILPGIVSAARGLAGGPMLVLLGWPFMLFAVLTGMANQNPRFALAALPPLAILLAVGLTTTAAVLRPRGRMALTIVFLIGLVWMVSGGVRLTQAFVDRKNDHLATIQWTEAHVPADARLFTFALTHTFKYYSRIETRDVVEITPGDLARRIVDPRPTFLLLDVEALESQWRGRPAYENYRTLQDKPGVVEVGRRGTFTLFRVADAR